MICMKRSKTAKLMTPREYAEKHDVAYTTVMKWLQNGLVKGAYKEPLPAPFKGYIYQIPEDASPPELKPGPKPGTQKASTKRGAKK